MHSGNIHVVEDSGSNPEDSFQSLLLRLSAAAAQGCDRFSLIHLFCQATREFFQASGTYYWELVSPDELVGREADGVMAERFRGTRLSTRSTSSAVSVEVVRTRKTVYRNNIDPIRFPMAVEYSTRSIMAAPLMVSGEVIGAVVFLHDSDPSFFNDDLAAKATILAGQFGSLLEASRLTQAFREEHRRTEILAEAARALNAVPNASAVIEALAERVRALLGSPLVCVLLREAGKFQIQALAAETPQLAASARNHLTGDRLQPAIEAADRAIYAGEIQEISFDSAAQGMQELAPAGKLLAAPFSTSRTTGAVLIYPRPDSAYEREERSLVAAIVGFGAVAIANAELYLTASNQAQELHQLLEISSELNAVADFDQFMKRFVERGGTFLGFRRSFLALLERGTFHVRWGAEDGKAQPADVAIPEGVGTRAWLAKEPFWTDDAAQLPGANPQVIAQYNIRQVLAVPLVGSDAKVLGVFGVLDHADASPISTEDVRRAQALAAEASLALEVIRNLHESEQHRHRAEALMSLTLEASSLLGLPDFARSFVRRASSMLSARGGALVLQQETGLETIILQGSGEDASLGRRLSSALGDSLSRNSEPILAGKAGELLNSALASSLGWSDLILARLKARDGHLAGVLCLADRASPLTREDEYFLQAIVGHASVALENARLFARVDQANRHWVEIFDAISDFIVVHDEQHRVLRVNRPLADFIGVSPGELIGISMSALLAMSADVAPMACPFCRSGVEGRDEFVQPVLERTYLVSTSRIHASQSETLQTIHVLKDITDRREAERRYRELFDNIQEGLFFTTPEGRFIEVNDAMVRMLGYDSREELLQAEIPTQIYFTSQRRQELIRLMGERGNLRNYHETLRRKDGSPIHVLMNAFAVRDAQGRIIQIRGLMLDITDLKNFQAELQRERDFSGKILNNTQSLILVADTAGLISYANRRWYEAGGYERGQLVGHPITGLIAPSRRQAMQDALQATLAGQHVDNLELPVMRADGRAGQFSVNLSPMRDDQGHVSSIVVVMSDITDAALLQAKLMHTEKLAAVGQLVSGVAHEVNNPLTAILGFADLLTENPEIPESARKDLRVILQEAQRTKQIVQNLLSFARQMPPQRRPVQVNSILSSTLQLRAYDFSSHGVEVVERLQENLPEVIGDSHQLQQVFLNILNNAYDAVRETGRPPRLEITTSLANGFAEISFRDNGHGIAQPERIFDPFFTTKEVGKGTGLGLSICYGIVREHAGEIFCHNNEDGPGATFVVRLPAVAEAAPAKLSAGALSS
jgi:PAS domain S-box-containing protein